MALEGADTTSIKEERTGARCEKKRGNFSRDSFPRFRYFVSVGGAVSAGGADSAWVGALGAGPIIARIPY